MDTIDFILQFISHDITQASQAVLSSLLNEQDAGCYFQLVYIPSLSFAILHVSQILTWSVEKDTHTACTLYDLDDFALIITKVWVWKTFSHVIR